jgi:hypothetical protein
VEGCSVAQKDAEWLRRMKRSLDIGCCVVQAVVHWQAVWQTRGSNLGSAPHGGFCLLSDGSEDLGDFSRGFLYM